MRKISPPTPGFDLQTVQPVASRYTDWATGPTEADLAMGKRIVQKETLRSNQIDLLSFICVYINVTATIAFFSQHTSIIIVIIIDNITIIKFKLFYTI